MKYCVLFLLLTSSNLIFAQTDTLNTKEVYLQPVEIKQYFNKQSILKLTNSAHTISKSILELQSPVTLTTAMNVVTGVRMEERSPGSYRIGMRGSLIRSPFGIRNTKVYIDELPFTDAGGNSYLNLIDHDALSAIHIIKGPDGSLFGANSGGVIRITPNGFLNEKNDINFQITSGSFGLLHQNLGINQKINDKYQFAINQSYTNSDGYRNNSELKKSTIQTSHKLNYTTSNTIKLFALYSDINYQTPGGLTLKQYEENPKASRPAAGPNPSAESQKAAIYNKTIFGGIGHDIHFNEKLIHYIGVFGSYTNFENPFITNYEFRIEKNLGLRSYISYQDNILTIPMEFQVGIETQNGWNKIDNYDNNKGISGAPQAKDLLNNKQVNLFSRAKVDLTAEWTLEGSLGLNKNSIIYETLYPTDNINEGKIKFNDVWLPRIASSYQINTQMAFRGSISKGYSTPTLAEVRSSNNIINNNLVAENGINYELGYKLQSENRNCLIDLSVYQYNMKNGIIRNLTDEGIEFYSNAGEMYQKGVELSFWSFLDLNNPFIKSIQFNTAATYNHYRFGNYTNGNTNYKDNKITSVPDWTLSNTLSVDLPKNLKLNIYHNHTSKIPLDDANTVFSDAYDLIQAKINWNKNLNKLKSTLTVFVGIDNVLNQKYSLGNDINAFGGRYFNASPTRNYYTGIKISFYND